MEVGITVQSINHPNYSERGYYLNVRWQEFADIVGITLIPINSLKFLEKLISDKYIKGVILSGGGNLSKGFPNKSSIIKSIGKVDLQREEIEKKLVDFSFKTNTPLIGVCRGMQALGLYYGAKLFKIENHVNTRHSLNYSCPILNKKINRKINCYHDFSIQYKSTSKHFNVNATHVESVEQMTHKNAKILGIMWHPERETKFSSLDIELFRKFFGLVK